MADPTNLCSGQRTGFGTAKGVLTITLADELTFESARQVELL